MVTMNKKETLNCPYCQFHFQLLAMSGDVETTDGIVPIVCERCGNVALLIFWPSHGENVGRTIRQVTPEELELLKQSPAWVTIATAQKIIAESKGASN